MNFPVQPNATRSSRFTPMGAVLALAFALPLAAQNDVIVEANGNRVRGLTISSTGSSEIFAEAADGERQFAIRQIREIVWGDMPESFGIAMAAERSGDYELASTKYDEALSANSRDIATPDVEFLHLRARAQGASNDANEAGAVADDLNGWLSANTDHYRIPDATYWRGKALILAGEGASAASILDQLEKDVLRNGWQPIWSARAKLSQGLAEIASGDPARARATLRAALSAAGSVNDDSVAAEIASLQTQATAAIGESMIAEGDADKALAFFRDGSSNESPALSAARKAGEGQALFVQAESSASVDEMRQAQVALAEAIVLDPEGGDVTAKAQFFMGKLLMLLGDEREQKAIERAKDYFRSIIDFYPDSRWAGPARSELDA